MANGQPNNIIPVHITANVNSTKEKSQKCLPLALSRRTCYYPGRRRDSCHYYHKCSCHCRGCHRGM